MEFNRKIEPSRKLNTKGCCFLCLQFENTKTEEFDGNQGVQTISIGQLLRHLQIPRAGKSTFGEDFKNECVEVDLCESCGHIISRFSILFQKLGKIQLEMSYFLERIHKCISQSAKDPELVQNYSKRMTSDLEALSQLAFVDNLRKQVAKESLRKLNVPRLQLVLTRTKNKRIKTEINEEACESNDGDFQGNYYTDSDGISPPPSPTATFDPEEDVKFSMSSASTSQENKKISPSVKPIDNRKSKKSKYFTIDVPTGMYKCNGCDKKSKSLRAIIHHFKIVHLNIRYKCDICNVSVFKQLDKVSRHKKTCRKNLEKKLAMEKDPRFKWICKICGKRFKTNEKHRQHLLTVHKNVDRYPCELCDKKFKKSDHLKDHRNAVHFRKRAYCGVCNKSFAYKRTMQSHKKKCAQKLSLKKEPQENV